MTRAARSYLVIAAIAFALGSVGCDADVAAPPRMEEPFSMYGILNPRDSVQTIAVAPIEPLLYDYPESIEAVITSTDLETGETVTWRDSVVVGERGQTDHVFWAEFRPHFGGDYLVTAVRSDGATTSAVAHVPDVVEVEAQADRLKNLQIEVSGKRFHLLSISLEYRLRLYPRATGDPCTTDPFIHTVPYDGKEAETEDGFRFAVNLGLDHFNIESLYVRSPNAFGVALMGMAVALIVAEPAWDPPGGALDEFDENTLSDPGVMTNTTNGFGLVAGGYNHESAVIPPEETVAQTKFFDFVARPPDDCVDYCKCL